MHPHRLKPHPISSLALVVCVPAITLAQAAPPPAKPAEPTTVVVTGAKRTVTNKIDRRVYDVSTSPQAAFATLNDVLTRIPSVTIDPHGAIALRGSPQVRVLIDGHTANPAVLRTLTAAQIERVEVITNPSAEFSSEGSAGIINIVLKKKRANGLNGSVNARGDDDGRYNLDASATWKAGRWSFTAVAGASHGKEKTREAGHQTWTGDGAPQTTDGADLSTLSRRQVYANLQVDDQVTPKDKLSVKASLNNAWQMVRDPETTRIVDSAGQVLQNYGDLATDPTGEFVKEFEATYDHEGRIDGETLSLDLVRTHTESPETSRHDYRFDAPAAPDATYVQTIVAPEDETSFAADYERPVKGGGDLKTGFSLDTRDNHNWRTAEGLPSIVPGTVDGTSAFRFTDLTTAAYVTYQMPLGKWALMPGLRVEHVHWNADLISADDDTRRDYWRWLPSLHLSRDLSDRLKWVASYSHRTQKPMAWELDPSIVYYSKSFAHAGNVALKPQDTDSLETGYEYEDGQFGSNGSVYVRKTYNAIVPTRTFTADDIIIASSVNAAHSLAAGVEYTAKGRFTKQLQYSVNLNLFDTEVEGMSGGELLRRTGGAYSGNAVLEYTPGAADWWQMTYSAQGRTLTLQGYTSGFDRLDVAWRHRLKTKWAFVVRGLDLLNSSKQQRLFVAPDGQTSAITRKQRPGVLVGLVYKFGRGS